MPTLTEIVVHRDIATMHKEHVEGDDENGHKDIDHPHVDILKHPDQGLMHPPGAIGLARPLLMIQLFRHTSLSY
jgi:hypothetical protein